MARGWKVQLQESGDINEAQALRNLSVFVKRSDLPEPSINEYYVCDLTGARVIDGKTQAIIGTLFDTESRSQPEIGHDIWWVKTPAGEIAIPAVRHFISEVDEALHRIVVRNLSELS